MDVSKLNPPGAATMQARHPADNKPLEDENGEPMTVSLFSAYSKEYAAAYNRALNGSFSGKRMRFDAATNFDNTTRMLAEITAKTSGNWEYNGEPIEDKTEQLVKLYDGCRWLREQALEFIEEQKNFLGN